MAKNKEKAENKQNILKAKGSGKARFISILLIIIAIFIGARTSLVELKQEALDYFFNGDPSNSLDYGIEYDLNQRVTKAGNLITVSQRYIDSNDSAIKAVQKDCDNITKSSEPNEKYKYNEKLTEDCYALVEALNKTDIVLEKNSYDFDLVVDIIIDMDSSNQIIGHSAYNQKAKEFNLLLEEFPINITSKFVFIKPLELFAY